MYSCHLAKEASEVPILQIDKCFGFDTAVEESQRALLAAKVEAVSAYRGIGIVKLMGRQSGFIAMQVLPKLMNLRWDLGILQEAFKQ